MLTTDDERNISDVRMMVQHLLSSHISDTATLRHVTNSVTEKSEGLFLYVRFFQAALQRVTCDENTILSANTFSEFPQGIEGFYQDYFQRLFDILGSELYQNILGAILASRGPLPKELWMRCFGIRYHFDSDSQTSGAFDKYWDVLPVLKSLVYIPSTINHPESTGILFIHKSMSEFLSRGRQSEQSALKLRLRHLHISVDGHGSTKLIEQLEYVSNLTSSGVAKTYTIRNLFYHYCVVGSYQKASRLMFDLDYLLLWLSVANVGGVLHDVHSFFISNALNLDDDTLVVDASIVAKLLRFSREALRKDYTGLRKPGKHLPSELPCQILARLSPVDVESHPRIKKLRNQASCYDPGIPWVRPVSASLDTVMPTKLLDVLRGHHRSVNSVAFNHDQTRIVSGSADSTIRIWDAITGQAIGEPLWGHERHVHSVAYNHDGSRIVSGSRDTTVRIWDASAGEEVGMPLRGHTSEIYSVAYNHNGTRIVSGSRDHSIRIWDAITGESIGGPWYGHEGDVYSVAFHPNGTQIVSGSQDHTIRVWDVSTAKEIGEPLRGHDSWVNAVAYNHDGSKVVSGSLDKTVRIWDMETCEMVGQPILGHGGTVSSVAFNHDGSSIVSCSRDKTIRVWDSSTHQLLDKQDTGHEFDVRCVAFSHNGTRIVSCSTDTTVRVWDAVSRVSSKADESHGYQFWVRAVTFNQEGTRIVSGSSDNTIQLWDATTGRALGDSIHGHEGSVNSVAFSPDGSRIVSGASDNTVRIWDTLTRQPIGPPLHGLTTFVFDVTFNHDGTLVLARCNSRGTIHVWDAVTGTVVENKEGSFVHEFCDKETMSMETQGNVVSVLPGEAIAFSASQIVTATSAKFDTENRVWRLCFVSGPQIHIAVLQHPLQAELSCRFPF